MADVDTYKTLDLTLRVGDMLLSNGAGAADARSTMLAVARACDLRGVSVDVTFTELTVNYHPSFDDPGLVQTRSVAHREIDYEDLTLVDHLVADLVAGRITRDEARARVARLASSHHRRSPLAITGGWGVMGLGTALLLGGGALVGLLAFVSAIGIHRIQRSMSARDFPLFYQQVAGGLLASLMAVLAVAVDLPVSPARVVTAGIIMLLAGIGLVGAAQDALTGFPVTANARILEATLATVGIIAGVSGGFVVGDMFGISLAVIGSSSSSGIGGLPLVLLGAALAASAFAFASYAPLRTLAPIALVGGFGSFIYWVVSNADFGPAWGTASAAVVIGAISFTTASRIRVPPLVVVVPSVLPLLPGLSIYQGLFKLAEGKGGSLEIVSAMATAIALASGAILGQYLSQPLKARRRGQPRSDRRPAGPRLVGVMRRGARPLVHNKAHD